MISNEPVPHCDLKRGKTYLAYTRTMSDGFYPTAYQYVKIKSKRGIDVRYESDSYLDDICRYWKLYEIGSDFEKQYLINLQNFQLKQSIISLVNELEITEHNKPVLDNIATYLINLKTNANSQL